MTTPESATTAARELVVTFSRLRRRLLEVSVQGDLTPSQTSALTRLAKGGDASTSALAADEKVRPQSMAATLAALEALGLVRRRQDPDDGRRQLVGLTAAGQETVDGGRAVREQWLVARLVEGCTEQERQTVVAAMAVVERLL